MKKVTTLVLMLCLVLSGALCYAHSVTRITNVKGEGAPKIIIFKFRKFKKDEIMMKKRAQGNPYVAEN